MQLNHTEKSNCSVFPTRVLFRKDRAVWIGVAEHIRSLNSTTRKTHRSATKAVPCLAAVDNGTPLFFRVPLPHHLPPFIPRHWQQAEIKQKFHTHSTPLAVGRSESLLASGEVAHTFQISTAHTVQAFSRIRSLARAAASLLSHGTA